MIASDFSFIIPVFNRPEEIRELLESFGALESPKTFEIVIIEDGSTLDSKRIVDQGFNSNLDIDYTKRYDEYKNYVSFQSLLFLMNLLPIRHALLSFLVMPL